MAERGGVYADESLNKIYNYSSHMEAHNQHPPHASESYIGDARPHPLDRLIVTIWDKHIGVPRIHALQYSFEGNWTVDLLPNITTVLGKTAPQCNADLESAGVPL